MIKKLLISIFLIIFYSASNAEVINQFVVEGNNRVSKDTIKIYGEIELNKEINENEINKIINNLYSTDFFENIKIEVSNNILKIVVKEYPVINQLVIIGEKKKGNVERIEKLLRLKENRAFIRSYLAKDIDIIKQYYSSLGYNFAVVEAKIKETDKNNLDLIIEINRGEKTKVSSISFLGNKSVRSKRLRDVIASEESKFWKVISRNTVLNKNLIELDKRLLINYYKSLGYYDVNISSNVAELNEVGDVDLVYSINEGKRYTINKISTNLDKVLNKELFFPLNNVFADYVGDYYSPFKVKKILEELDLLIAQNNLQFIEHNVKEEIENDSINLTLNVFEGKKNLVERINIIGNNVTNESVIRGELILDEGDPYTKLNLEKSISKIKARRIFQNVSYEVKNGSKDNLKIIDIIIEEGPTGEISAGAGIGTSGGTVVFSLKENNWLGEGKTIGFDLDLTDESVIGKLNYLDPNYNFLGNSISYTLASENNDKPDLGYENTVYSASIGTSFEQYRDVRVRLGLSASHDDLKTESTASTSLKKQSGTFDEIATNYSFTFDKRDRAFMPTSGSVTSFTQEIPLYANKSFISNTFSTSVYKSFSENLIGASKLYISTINGLGDDDVRLSKRKGLFQKRLRGFEKNKVGPVDGTDHIGGNYAAALNFETSLPKLLPENSNTDVGLFLDLGSVWGVDYDSSLDDSNKIRSSTGISASWLSPIGPLTFVISQNLSKADTDVTESFSLNLGTSF